MKKYILERIYHYSTYLTSWSWRKLYGNRTKRGEKIYYVQSMEGGVMSKIVKADNWDGKSRPSNKAYDESWNRIFGKKENDELDESLKQSISE
jgi:hypothetical protein